MCVRAPPPFPRPPPPAHPQVSLVKDYVSRQLTAESAEIAKDRATIARLQAETATMKEEAQKLKTQVCVCVEWWCVDRQTG